MLIPVAVVGTTSSSTTAAPVITGTLPWWSQEVMAGYSLARGGAFSFQAWPSANRAILQPFSLPSAKTAQKVWWYNGGTASGNVDAGIYNEDGTLIIAIGGTAQVGTVVAQVASLSAPTVLAAGSYFFALVLDNTTGVVAANVSDQPAALQGNGVQQAATAYPLPSTVTLAAPVSVYLPIFSLGFTTVL